MTSSVLYTENLQAVGSIAVTLQQAFSRLQHGVNQLLTSVDEAQQLLKSSKSCCQDTETLLHSLQTAFRQSGLEVGKAEWQLGGRNEDQCKIDGSLATQHVAVAKQLGACGEHVDKLMSLVGKHLLVANFSPEPAVHTGMPQSGHVHRTPTQGSNTTPTSSATDSPGTQSLQLDYTEDVAMVKASIMDDSSASTDSTRGRLDGDGNRSSSASDSPAPRLPLQVHDALSLQPQDDNSVDEHSPMFDRCAPEGTDDSNALPVQSRHAGPENGDDSFKQLDTSWYKDTSGEVPFLDIDSTSSILTGTRSAESHREDVEPCPEAAQDDNIVGLQPHVTHTAGNMRRARSAGGLHQRSGVKDGDKTPVNARDATPGLNHAEASSSLSPHRMRRQLSGGSTSSDNDKTSSPKLTRLRSAHRSSGDLTGNSDSSLMFFDMPSADAPVLKRKPRLSSEAMPRSPKVPQRQIGQPAKTPSPRVSRVSPKLQKQTSTSSVGDESQQQRQSNAAEATDVKKPMSRFGSRSSSVKSSRTASPNRKSFIRRPTSNSKSSLAASGASSASNSPTSLSENSMMASAVPAHHGSRHDMSTDDRQLVLTKEGGASLGFRMCGGRGYGVFVEFVTLGGVAHQSGMQVGDRIMKFKDRDFSSMTHCAAGHSMLGLAGDIPVSVKYSIRDYENLPKGRETQDDFYIRCRVARPSEAKKSVQDLSTSPGDIFHVVETAPRSHEDSWKVHQVNSTTGVAKDKTGYILSRKTVEGYLRSGSSVASPLYESVTPVKCDHPRPVLLLGPPQVVAALKAYLLKEHDKTFCTCPFYDVMDDMDMSDRADVLLLTNVHDSRRQTFVYKTSVKLAAEKGSHCLLDAAPGDVAEIVASHQCPIVILLIKNKSVVVAKEEYGISWLQTGNITLSSVVRRDSQAVLRVIQEQQKQVSWAPQSPALSAENS